MNVRKVFFWAHLIAGCVGGVIILLMSITGVVLTYERQILAKVERGPYRVEAAGAQRLPVEEVLAKVATQTTIPANANLTLRSDPTEPAEIAAGRDGTFYVNPYTGQVLGKPSPEWRGYFQKLTSWHRWLGAEGEGRAMAKAITGACNLAFLGIVLSGMYLWIPKQWSKQHLKPITWFRGGISGKARDFNWHNVFGIWSAVPLVFVVATAVPMSYPWATTLLYTITGTEAPAPNQNADKGKAKGKGKEGGRREGGGQSAPEQAAMDFAGLNPLWARAATQVPEWTSISARISDRGPLSFAIDTGDGGQPQKKSTLVLARQDAGVVRWETFNDNNTGRRLRSWARFVHTGEAYGLTGQTVAGIASFGGVMLVWTGISLALRRFATWRKRKRAVPQEIAETAAAR